MPKAWYSKLVDMRVSSQISFEPNLKSGLRVRLFQDQRTQLPEEPNKNPRPHVSCPRETCPFRKIWRTMGSMKTAILAPETEAAVWLCILHPDGELGLDTARAILQLSFPESEKYRMRQLSAKARAGTLTPA